MSETTDTANQKTLTLQQAIDLAVEKHVAGKLPEAEAIYQQILQADPHQPVPLHLLGVIAQQVGKLDIAVDLIEKALAIQPDYADAHNNLGNTYKKLGRLDEAITSYQKVLAIKPDFAEVHNNLGMTLSALERFDLAVNSFHKAIAGKTDYLEAWLNLGNAFRGLGKQGDVIASYEKALAIDPACTDALVNLGNALKGTGRVEDAIANYRKALSIQPDLAEAHNNLGLAFKEQAQPEEAVNSFQKAIAIKADYIEAYCNLGNTFSIMGRLEQSVASYCKAIAIRSDFAEAWNNLMFAAKARSFSQGAAGDISDFSEDDFSPLARASADYAMFDYYLAAFKPHTADKSFAKAMAALPAKADQEIIIGGVGESTVLADKLVALLHFGRSGTGLLHSLIDGHPEVSTVPSIYLRGFFGPAVWNRISGDGWRRLPERFADEFAVLFDANSAKPSPGRSYENSVFLGKQEGMANVGENRDEVLGIDREKFCAEARLLMQGMQRIDPGSFLLVVHAAFEKATRSKTNKHCVFYHIHNPDNFNKLNFLRYMPDARLLMMVREPIQCCESWMRKPFDRNQYSNVALRIMTMLFDIDQPAFRSQGSVGLRLEDLKMRPEATIKSLCAWLAIENTASLYEMTAQGKKWWGDPSSPDFGKDKAMSPFDDAAIKRPTGSILGETDQFILETLFYPFSVRFGYREPDPQQFQSDLKEIRPMLDEMMDFEKTLAERMGVSHSIFRKNGAYQLLRAAFFERWQVLDEFADYPGLLEPLHIL